MEQACVIAGHQTPPVRNALTATCTVATLLGPRYQGPPPQLGREQWCEILGVAFWGRSWASWP